MREELLQFLIISLKLSFSSEHSSFSFSSKARIQTFESQTISPNSPLIEMKKKKIGWKGKGKRLENEH